MLSDTWLLIRLYLKLDRRAIQGRSLSRYVALAFALFGIVIIGITSGLAGYGIGRLVATPDLPVEIGPGLVPGVLLTIVLVGVLVTGLNQAVRALFLSGDLDRLVVAPVRTRSVMVAKLLSRLPTNVGLMFLIAAPAFVTYGVGVGAGPVYYVVGLLMLLLAPLFGLSVGALIAMLLVRLLPVNRLNELLAASYAVLGIVIALAFQLPRLFLGENGPSPEMVMSIGETTGRLERLPLPTLAAGRGLVGLDTGRFDAPGLLGILFYLLLTAGLFAVVVLTTDRLYLSGWLRTQSAGTRRRGLDEDAGVFGGRSLGTTLAWKDWLLRLRDPRQLVSLLGNALIAVVVGGLALFRGNGGDSSLYAAASQGQLDVPGFGLFTAVFTPGLMVAAFALFVAFLVFSNLALSAVALEGGSLDLLKSAPLTPREIFRAKLVSVMIPYAGLFLLALVLSWLFVGFNAAWGLYALLAGVILGYGMLASNTAAGFRFANLAWTDPRRMTSGGGGLVGLLFSVLYAIPAAVVIFLAFALSQLAPQWTLLLVAGGLLLAAAMAWGWTAVMGRWAEGAWAKLGAG